MIICRSNLLKTVALTASLSLMPDAGPMTTYAGEAAIEQCLAPAICPIPYVRLAKQETEPFLFLGKVMDEDHPRFHQYRTALRRFPSVRSCLITKERETAQPDLRQIDWHAISDVQEIEVCVFRTASSIEEVETIKTWLRHHDYRVNEGSRIRRDSYVSRYETEPMFGFASFLSVERFREIVPRSWFARLIGFEGARSHSLTISFSQSGQVVGVAASGSTIFN